MMRLYSIGEKRLFFQIQPCNLIMNQIMILRQNFQDAVVLTEPNGQEKDVTVLGSKGSIGEPKR
jgi:hypothetical protein